MPYCTFWVSSFGPLYLLGRFLCPAVPSGKVPLSCCSFWVGSLRSPAPSELVHFLLCISLVGSFVPLYISGSVHLSMCTLLGRFLCPPEHGPTSWTGFCVLYTCTCLRKKFICATKSFFVGSLVLWSKFLCPMFLLARLTSVPCNPQGAG